MEEGTKAGKAQGAANAGKKQQKVSATYTCKSLMENAKKLRALELIDEVEENMLKSIAKSALGKHFGGEWF